MTVAQPWTKITAIDFADDASKTDASPLFNTESLITKLTTEQGYFCFTVKQNPKTAKLKISKDKDLITLEFADTKGEVTKCVIKLSEIEKHLKGYRSAVEDSAEKSKARNGIKYTNPPTDEYRAADIAYATAERAKNYKLDLGVTALEQILRPVVKFEKSSLDKLFTILSFKYG